MIVTETIPNLLSWTDIKPHCRLDDDGEKDYLVNLGLATTEAFEKETAIATTARTLTVVYSYDDLVDRKGLDCNRNYYHSYYNNCYHNFPYLFNYNTLVIPKSPVISITSISNATTTLDAANYELRKQGHVWYVHFKTNLSAPITLVCQVGFATVPQLIKQACLIHTETLYRIRGATSNQEQHVMQLGLERIYSLYDTAKALVG